MTLDEAIKQNPYDEKQNNLSAYVRYLRYTVDGFFNKTSEEVKAILAEKLQH